MVEFLSCPSWVNPIEIFLDENCALFDEGEENHQAYLEIFKKFEGMIEILLEGFITELNISEEQFEQQFVLGLQIKRDRKYFEQLIVAQDFEKFKRQMIRKNKALELESLEPFQNKKRKHWKEIKKNKKKKLRNAKIYKSKIMIKQ